MSQTNANAFDKGLNMINTNENTNLHYGITMIHVLLFIFLLIIIGWIVRKYIFYRGSNFKKSLNLSFQLRTPVDGDYVGGSAVKRMANAAVMASRVYLSNETILIKIPVKSPWQIVANMEVQRVIKEKINSDEFRDYLANSFENVTFSTLSTQGNYYVLVGE